MIISHHIVVWSITWFININRKMNWNLYWNLKRIRCISVNRILKVISMRSICSNILSPTSSMVLLRVVIVIHLSSCFSIMDLSICLIYLIRIFLLNLNNFLNNFLRTRNIFRDLNLNNFLNWNVFYYFNRFLYNFLNSFWWSNRQLSFQLLYLTF
jgi:hypothetical protein